MFPAFNFVMVAKVSTKLRHLVAIAAVAAAGASGSARVARNLASPMQRFFCPAGNDPHGYK
jgi:hypothetical protein